MRRYAIGIATVVVCATLLGTAPDAQAASVPNARFTPGLADTTYDPVAHGCASVTTAVAMTVPKPIAKQVWKRYDIGKARQSHFRLDLLVPGQLGGMTDLANVWPLAGRDTLTKDAATMTVLAKVCAGKVPLADAQHWFATDWTTAAANADAAAAARDAYLSALEQAKISEDVIAEWQRLADEEAAARAAAEAAAVSASPSSDGTTVVRRPTNLNPRVFAPRPPEEPKATLCNKIGYVRAPNEDLARDAFYIEPPGVPCPDGYYNAGGITVPGG